MISQALALLYITMDDWRKVHKQKKLADWFEKSHGKGENGEHIQFFIGAAKGRLPCWSPNSNPIESWHHTLGDIPGLISRASFTNMLEVNIPAICKDASINLHARGWLLQPTFVPLEMAEVALKRATEGPPIFMHNPDKSVYKIVSRRYMEKHPDEGMSMELLKRYTKSLAGKFPEGVSKTDAQEIATSINTIRLDPRCKGPCNPGWRCDCKSFITKGLCSCVLCLSYQQGTFDLTTLLKKCARLRRAALRTEPARVVACWWQRVSMC